MKSLTLVIDGKNKTFTTPYISGLVWRTWLELQEKAENLQNLSVKELDDFVNLVVMAFDNQFTLDQFYKGIPFHKVMETIETLFIPPSKEEQLGNGKK